MQTACQPCHLAHAPPMYTKIFVLCIKTTQEITKPELQYTHKKLGVENPQHCKQIDNVDARMLQARHQSDTVQPPAQCLLPKIWRTTCTWPCAPLTAPRTKKKRAAAAKLKAFIEGVFSIKFTVYLGSCGCNMPDQGVSTCYLILRMDCLMLHIRHQPKALRVQQKDLYSSTF